jgi:hypothetical protein
VFVLLFAISSTAFADPETQLLDVVRKDPSFKVRMQAIRVLTKRITAQQKPASDAALGALGDAATHDESHLVRGLACFSLGQLGDNRVRPVLERATKDDHPFVREQAEQALRQLPTTGPEPGIAMKALPLPGRNDATSANTSGMPPPSSSGPKAIVLSVEQPADSAIPRESLDRLRSGLEERLKNQAGAGFVLGQKTGRGFHLAGSIADRRLEENGGKARISLVVRVTISTWPESHLRHVVTARATAETASSSDSGRARLEQRVLDAAVRQAVDEALAEISRE